MFESCARLPTGGGDGCLKTRSYHNKCCLHALKRGKQSADSWKTEKNLKDINEGGLAFFSPCRRKVC